MSVKCTRPILRWHGGKWMLAPWIIANMPKHRVYVEPFGGAASVLLRKTPAYAEIYNDLDDEVVMLMRILRDPARASELQRRLLLTPFARTEFNEAYEPSKDPIETVRHLIIRSFMGFGSDGCNDAAKTGFRANSSRSGTTPAHDWVNYPQAMDAMVARLSRVVIENKTAIEVMRAHDGPETLHYADPPYMHETRAKARNSVRKNYRHELSDADHSELLSDLKNLTGMVMVSGYPSDLYDSKLSGWHRIERSANADGARPRVEVLWLNDMAYARRAQGSLFSEKTA